MQKPTCKNLPNNMISTNNISMKKLITPLFLLSILGACKPEDKTETLKRYKEEYAILGDSIKKLEARLASEGKQEDLKLKSVVVTELSTNGFKHFVEVQGKVDAEENVNVSAKMAGEVTKIYVKPGTQVHEGQLIAETDNKVMAQGIQELKSQLEFATNLYEKQKHLWDQKIGSEVQFLSAKNNKEALEKKLITLNEQSDMSKLKAPISGTVDAVDIKVGQMIMPGMPAIRIINLGKLKVKAEVAESYASKIKIGKDVTIYFPDLQKEIPGKVSYSAKVINNVSRAFSVEVELSNTSDYQANMIAILKIVDYQNDSAISIPINIVQTTEAGQFVYVAEKKGENFIAKKVPVKTGNIYNGKAEIISGLKNKDFLITTGFQNLNDGEYIKF